MFQAPALSVVLLLVLATVQGCRLARSPERFRFRPSAERGRLEPSQGLEAEILPLLIEGCLRSLARRFDAGPSGRARVGVFGVELAGEAAVGAWPAPLQRGLEEALTRSGRFGAVVTAESDAILRAAGLRRASLRGPEGRRQFMASAWQAVEPLDFVLMPTFSQRSGERGGALRRDHSLTLELVELATGRTWFVAQSVREEFAP